MIVETWIKINGASRFEISDLGRVRSFCSLDEGKILIHGFDERGYPQVNIVFDDGRFTSQKIHRLVWDHFGDEQREGRDITVDHIDFNKTNNWINNLQLLTNRDNNIKSKRKPGKLLGAFARRGGYTSKICIKGKYKYLGDFTTEQLAHEAYMIEYNKEKTV